MTGPARSGMLDGKDIRGTGMPVERACEAPALADRRAPAQSGLAYAWAGDGPLLPAMTPGRRTRLAAKRAFDLLTAGAAILLLSPLLLAVAGLVALPDGGPVLFRQTRVGLHGRPFQVLKFRSMAASGQVTPIGRLLRRTSLDELPQLFNVARGEMSLVGPRPHVPGMQAGGTAYDRLVPYYARRQAMKPGMTGWAQAHGLRGPADDPLRARARIDHDLAYIQNFSLALDLRIILRTIRIEFLTGTGR